MFMKNRILLSACLFLAVLIASTSVRAQNPIEDAIKQLTSENVKGYLEPFTTGFGMNLNSGVYHSADIGTLGLTFRLDLIASGTLIGDAEKKYSASNPYDGSPVETATIFGGLGTIVGPVPGVEYQFQNGQIKTSIFPFIMPQLTVGDLYGTQAVIRYVPVPEIGNTPKVNLFGLGIRHSVSQYIPAVPLDVTASVFYQTLKIGDLMEAKCYSFGAQASKSFAILTLYGGLQDESMSLDLHYKYAGNIPGVTVADPNISVTLDGKNHFRATAGADISLAIMHIFADINVGSAVAVSGGIGFGL